MFERLEQIETRYEELGRELADPEVIADLMNRLADGTFTVS